MKNNKLFTIILSLMLVSVLYSCNGTTDPEQCLKSVKEKFPQSQIYSTYESNIYFIVIDSTGVKLVKTASVMSPKVTDVKILIKQQ